MRRCVLPWRQWEPRDRCGPWSPERGVCWEQIQGRCRGPCRAQHWERTRGPSPLSASRGCRGPPPILCVCQICIMSLGRTAVGEGALCPPAGPTDE